MIQTRPQPSTGPKLPKNSRKTKWSCQEITSKWKSIYTTHSLWKLDNDSMYEKVDEQSRLVLLQDCWTNPPVENRWWTKARNDMKDLGTVVKFWVNTDGTWACNISTLWNIVY